ncbi:MAG: hypothetical protein ACP5K9_00620 [Candidatus Micrarchaeia archaeon]
MAEKVNELKSKASLINAKRGEANTEQTVEEKINAVLYDALKEVKNYVSEQMADKESAIRATVKEMRAIKKSLGISRVPLYEIPMNANELSRLSGTNVVEKISAQMPGPYSLEVLVMRSFIDSVILRMREIAASLNDFGTDINYGELVSGIYIVKHNVERLNKVSAEDWYNVGNRYAISILALLSIDANGSANGKDEVAKPEISMPKMEDAINYKLSKLQGLGFVLDDKTLSSAWQRLVEKYSLQKYSKLLASLDGFSRLLYSSEVPSYAEVVRRAYGQTSETENGEYAGTSYETGNADKSMRLDVFILSTAAQMALSKFIAVFLVEGEMATIANKEINLAIAIDRIMAKNEIDVNFLKLFGEVVNLLYEPPKPIINKASQDSMYG